MSSQLWTKQLAMRCLVYLMFIKRYRWLFIEEEDISRSSIARSLNLELRCLDAPSRGEALHRPNIVPATSNSGYLPVEDRKNYAGNTCFHTRRRNAGIAISIK